uniref:phosphatidate cytidylyltransferase n=1 Tax=Arundo donax TaxID=35708 RepID=A0A0A9GB28_ARUDO
MAAPAAAATNLYPPFLLLLPSPLRPRPALRLGGFPLLAAAAVSAGGGGGGEVAARKADKTRQLQKRVLVGVSVGVGAGGVVVAGGWVFAAAVAAAVLAGAREYFELVRGTAGGGGTPPPRYVSRVCSAICAFMPILTLVIEVEFSYDLRNKVPSFSALCSWSGSGCLSKMICAFDGLLLC